MKNLNDSRKQIVPTLLFCVVVALIWKLVPHPIIPLVIGLAPFAVLIAFRLPFVMILLFVIFSFFRIHEAFPVLYNFKIPLLLSLGSLGALAWHLLITQKIQTYWRPELKAISIFFVLCVVGIVLASNRPIAIEYFKNIFSKIIIMTYAITWLTRESKDFSMASVALTFSGLLVGIVAVSNKLQGIGLVEGTRVTIGRAFDSSLSDPNDLALVLMFPVAFALSLVMTKGLGRLRIILGVISVIILFWAVLATQSRGGLLGILTIFGTYGYKRIKSKLVFFAGGGVSAMLLFVAAGISGRSSGGAAEEGLDESAMGRLWAWEAAIGMAVDRPLSGVGLDNFFANYFYYSPHWDGLNHAVHSTWFGVLAETGFLGFFVFITAIVMLIKSSTRSLKILEENYSQIEPSVYAVAQAVHAGLLGTIVSATFLTQGFTWPIYILAALVVAVAQWIDVNIKECPPPLNENLKT